MNNLQTHNGVRSLLRRCQIELKHKDADLGLPEVEDARKRLAGMNKRQAAIQAGYAVSTASIMAKRLTDRLTCCQAFIEEMQRQGLTIEAIVGEIKRGMTEAVNPRHPDYPDNLNRRAYTDMAIRLYGGYAPTKVDVEKDSREDCVMVDIETIRIAENLTGEKLIDEDRQIMAPGKDDESPL